MSERLVTPLLLCLVIAGIAVFGAGCLEDGDDEGAVTDPGIEASYAIARRT